MTVENTPSISSVFHDLNMRNPLMTMKKSIAASGIQREISNAGLDHKTAAERMSISSDKLRSILKGNFEETDTVESLEAFLTLLRAQ